MYNVPATPELTEIMIILGEEFDHLLKDGSIRISDLVQAVSLRLDPQFRASGAARYCALEGLEIWARLYCAGGEKAVLWDHPGRQHAWTEGLPNMSESANDLDLLLDLDHMTLEDFDAVTQRLQDSADESRQKADALQRDYERRKAAGEFADSDDAERAWNKGRQ